MTNAAYRKEWRLYFYGREWLIVRSSDLRAGEKAMPNPGWISDQLLHAAADTFTRGLLLDICGEYWRVSESPHDEWHHLCARLDEEFRRRSLVVVQPGAAPVQEKSGGGAPPAAPKEAAQTSGPIVKPKKKTWVAIRLVDESNAPVANEAYRITLPDNTVREGKTNSAGEAWVEEIDPGNCKITFPDLDASEWRAV